ncbi:hypothetical protein [Membranihabitans maritimus]|uniref:hypothetical protein n=1 Tax=Membranihabitans maritimus TaxID=2904244 RepID=UPI001F4841AD|nr:hypothetical protein [Membranihabitans maritimus]
MLLTQLVNKEKVLRNAEVEWTMYPKSSTPKSICYILNEEFIDLINDNLNISAVITPEQFIPLFTKEKGIFLSDSPQKDYYNLHNQLARMGKMKLISDGKISPHAQIHPTAIIEDRVIIEDGVEISAYTIIRKNTVICKGTSIGSFCEIGARGMQNIYVDGDIFNLEFMGGVEIGENCEILSHAIIQKPYHAYNTKIGRQNRISVKTSIGHGSIIGNYNRIAGNGTLSGNVQIGNYVKMGPSVTISDAIKIGNFTRIRLGSVVSNNISENSDVSGNFALDHKKNLKNYARIRK